MLLLKEEKAPSEVQSKHSEINYSDPTKEVRSELVYTVMRLHRLYRALSH